ncbi:MAG: sel1 repeat family protein [Pseudomonadales bacterium]|nr:sel1 repeat family protein [Pseudomonadales bacterium]
MNIFNIIGRYKRFFILILSMGLISVNAKATEMQVEQCLLDVKSKYFTKALDSCEIAAKTGNASAQLEYGSLYYLGYKGIPVDYDKTLKWISKSAAQGEPAAEHTMGELYDFGFGVEANKETAFAWYKKAANSGVVGAQINVGLMYFDGVGIAQNKTLGYMWVKVAAHRAGDMAYDILSEMQGALSTDEIATASTKADAIITRVFP